MTYALKECRLNTMKKAFLFAAFILSLNALCLALELEETKVRESEHQPFIKELRYKTDLTADTFINSDVFKGTVEAITRPGNSQGSTYKITVVNDKEIKRDFTFIPGLIMVLDYKKNILKLKDLKVGDKVIIEYTLMKNNENKVMSITLL